MSSKVNVVSKIFCAALKYIIAAGREGLENDYPGEKIQGAIVSIIVKSFDAELISSEDWKNKYSDCRRRSLSKNFNFTDMMPMDRVFIVEDPNGTQQWSDILVIYNGIGLPIEVKSSKGNKFLWNVGHPRNNAVYIFVGKSDVNLSLGQHHINDVEREIMTSLHNKASKLYSEANAKLEAIDSNWREYLRPMHEQKVISDKYFSKCTKETLSHILDLKWNTKQQFDWSGDVLTMKPAIPEAVSLQELLKENPKINFSGY